MKNLFLIFIFIVLLSACQMTGTLQGLFTYQKKALERNPNLFHKVDNCNKDFLSYRPNTVFIMNGKTLKNCMHNGKSIVYLWNPNCTAEACVSPDSPQQICNRIGAELYVVASYYDVDKMTVNYNLQNSLIAIDNDYYNTIFVKSQLNKFFSDLTGIEKFKYYLDKNIMDQYFLFMNGKFIDSSIRISDLIKEENSMQ